MRFQSAKCIQNITPTYVVIRIHPDLVRLDPDPDSVLGMRIQIQEQRHLIDLSLQIILLSSHSKRLLHLRGFYEKLPTKSTFSCYNSLFVTWKSDQDPDPHWGKKSDQDPDPHWNQCRSTTMLPTIFVPLSLSCCLSISSPLTWSVLRPRNQPRIPPWWRSPPAQPRPLDTLHLRGITVHKQA